MLELTMSYGSSLATLSPETITDWSTFKSDIGLFSLALGPWMANGLMSELKG